MGSPNMECRLPPCVRPPALLRFSGLPERSLFLSDGSSDEVRKLVLADFFKGELAGEKMPRLPPSLVDWWWMGRNWGWRKGVGAEGMCGRRGLGVAEGSTRRA